MRFHDDMSYVGSELVKRGLVRAVPYSIRLDRYFTDEQKKANREYAESHTSEEWGARCDETRKCIAAENFKLMEYLKSFFKFGQYDKGIGYSDCDLWFWCNDLYNTTNGRESGRDYSYITLTFTNEDNYEANELVYEAIKKLLADYPADNIQAIFQYAQIEIPENVEQEAERICKAGEGTFVMYNGYLTGRLKKYDESTMVHDENLKGKYIFKRKNAKRYVYVLNPLDVCTGIRVGE